MYDWLIRIDDEVRLFWRFRTGHKPPLAVLTYALSRYAPIIQFSILVRSIYPMCHVGNVIQAVAGLLSILTPTIFSTLRVYALSGGNRVLAGVAFLLCSVPFGVNAMNVVRFVKAVNMYPPFNCSGLQTMPKHLLYGTCLIAGDLIVLLVTWVNTYAVSRVKLGMHAGPSILHVMLLITSMNTAQMVIAPLKIPSILNICGYVNLFITPITSLLICHFLLDLHQAGHVSASTLAPTDISPIQFATYDSSSASSSSSSSKLSSFEESLGSDYDPQYCGEHVISSVRLREVERLG
ncbi:hypothetical protein V8D89_001227 [Ganoderma adspersum]